MARFAYEALTGAGRTVHGVQEASSAPEAERSLRDRGLRPLELAPASRPALREGSRMRRRPAAVAAVFRQLATLLAAGFPLDRALGTVETLTGREDVARALSDVRESVRAGSSLADALDEEGEVFPSLSVGMTRAGERGGRLAEAVERLADQLERQEELRGRIASALLYPALMAVVGGAALLVLVLYVLPRFVGILEEAGAALPRSTALLLSASGFLGDHWLPLLIAGVLAGGATTAWLRSRSGRARTSALLFRLPVVAPLRRRAVAARFGHSLAALLESGLPILRALETAAASLADPAAAAEVEEAGRRVQAGRGLADALAEGRAFPPLFLRMTALGEEGGRLAELLERAAGTAEDELERRLERLVRLVEPTLIVLFGAIVGFVALALLQAIYGVRLGAF